MSNLDRFEQGLPDPQEAKVIEECLGCGNEIYEGQDVVHYGDELYCNYKCLADAFGATRITAGED